LNSQEFAPFLFTFLKDLRKKRKLFTDFASGFLLRKNEIFFKVLEL